MSLITVVNNTVESVKEAATYAVMDSIIKYSSMQATYGTIMLGANAAQVVRNEKLSPSASSDRAKALGLSIASDIISGISGAIGLIDIGLVTETATAFTLSKTRPYLQSLWEKILIEPNIEGVPISASTLTTSREIEVGEQMMIVQSTSQKKYWTDNAVPRLKEWILEGYITTSLTIDSQYLIKPSLKMQMNFLDTCASSRRPVLFKDNRGEFMFVQITNLQTTEEASYNNAIKVNISLKEYKPFTVDNTSALLETAVKLIS